MRPDDEGRCSCVSGRFLFTGKCINTLAFVMGIVVTVLAFGGLYFLVQREVRGEGGQRRV